MGQVIHLTEHRTLDQLASDVQAIEKRLLDIQKSLERLRSPDSSIGLQLVTLALRLRDHRRELDQLTVFDEIPGDVAADIAVSAERLAALMPKLERLAERLANGRAT